MKINLITPEQHTSLSLIFNNYPNLTLQNKGYETPDKSKFSEEDKIKFEEVTALLKKTIHGFNSFKNFRLNKTQEIELRFDYNYNYGTTDLHFIGVGYILLDELLYGFKNGLVSA